MNDLFHERARQKHADDVFPFFFSALWHSGIRVLSISLSLSLSLSLRISSVFSSSLSSLSLHSFIGILCFLFADFRLLSLPRKSWFRRSLLSSPLLTFSFSLAIHFASQLQHSLSLSEFSRKFFFSSYLFSPACFLFPISHVFDRISIFSEVLMN